jgi:hypothetical protein
VRRRSQTAALLLLELGSGYCSAFLVTTNEDEAVVALLERRGTALALML